MVLFDSDEEEEAVRLMTRLASETGLEVSSTMEGGELGKRVAPCAETKDTTEELEYLTHLDTNLVWEVPLSIVSSNSEGEEEALPSGNDLGGSSFK